MLTSKITASKDRTWSYLTLYVSILILLGTLGCLIPALLVWYTNKSDFSLWVFRHFWWLTGLTTIIAGHIILWSYFDRRTKANTGNIYHNPFYRPEVGIEYKVGFNVGNPLEKKVDQLLAVIGIKKIPEKEPLDGTAIDDILQIWGTITVQSTGPEFFNLGKDRDESMRNALLLAEDRISSIIESWTIKKYSHEVLGHGLDLTAHVNQVCASDETFASKGFTAYWETGKMDESEDVKKAKIAQRENSIFAQAVKELASEPNKDGTYPIGSISQEDAAAINLARQSKGDFGKKTAETVIRVTGDPAVIDFLKGQGLLVGTASEHIHNTTQDGN